MGQFSITGAYALFIRQQAHGRQKSFYGTGKFRNNSLLATTALNTEQVKHFINNPEPYSLTAADPPADLSNITYILFECGVDIIVPVIHEQKLIAIFGLGPKVTKKHMSHDDMDLLRAIMNAIAPLIVNSMLFQQISAMSSWYLQILNNVKQGVFVFNDNHRLIKINDQGFGILKIFKPHLSTVQVVDRVPMELIFPPKYYPGWIQRFKSAAVNANGTTFEKMKAYDGQCERLFNVGISFVSDGSDNASDVIITLDDVTDQEENEQRLFELSKFAEKGMMASSISHELNNHLGLLMGGVELSQVALNKGLTDKASETLGKVKDNIEKMERFTAGLMDFARLETRKSQGNINTIITDVLSFVASQKRFRTVSIQTELLPSLPDLFVDADQIAQLLLNLLNNAADAIKEAKPGSPQIIVGTACDGKRVSIMISDNGIGIKPEIKNHLFKSHLTTKPTGHGYGLVTCGKIIENHQGEVDIDSKVGEGTTFTIGFPVIIED
jgi:signal transduction histidine kinase